MQLKNRIFLSLQFKNTNRNKFNINIDPTRAPKEKKNNFGKTNNLSKKHKKFGINVGDKRKKTKSGKFDQRYY